MPDPMRGEVWRVDLGMTAKIRPCLVLTNPPGNDDLKLYTIVPHTTALRGIQWEVSNGLLRIERTDPPSDEAPYGVKHVRLEPVEDSLIYVNYPRFSGVECIPSGS
jgi:hypothetical protein